MTCSDVKGETTRSYLVLGNCDRFRESEEWQSEIDETVFVLLDIGLAVDDLCRGKDE